MVKGNHNMQSAEQKDWEVIRARLCESIGQAKFARWLEPLQFGEIEKDRIILYAPTNFLRHWISDHYGHKIRQCWNRYARQSSQQIMRVEIVCLDNMPLSQSAKMVLEAPSKGKDLTLQEVRAPVETPIIPHMSFDNFVSGESNQLPLTILRDLSDYIAGESVQTKIIPDGPLFIHGSIGQGKTHLLHAFANQLRKKAPNHSMRSLAAERFRYHFVRSLSRNENMDFKGFFNQTDILIIDDLQFLSGKATQNELFHILKMVVDHQGRIIVAGTKPPTQLDNLDRRIQSLLGGGLVIEIKPAGQKLRHDILRAILRKLQPPLTIAPSIIHFLAQNITDNIRELEGALNRIIAHAQHDGGQLLDVDQARLILRDLLQTHQKRITVSDIQKQTALYYDISLNDLLSARKQRAIARPRQIAMFLAKELTPRSLPDIGRRFGGRDHTTVLHAVRRIEKLALTDTHIEEDVDNLRKLCQNAANEHKMTSSKRSSL